MVKCQPGLSHGAGHSVQNVSTAGKTVLGEHQTKLTAQAPPTNGTDTVVIIWVMDCIMTSYNPKKPRHEYIKLTANVLNNILKIQVD